MVELTEPQLYDLYNRRSSSSADNALAARVAKLEQQVASLYAMIERRDRKIRSLDRKIKSLERKIK